MQTYQTVAEYDTAIRPNLSSISHLETRITVEELLDYAVKKEKEAENREQRPRPDGSENAAYFRAEIDLNLITSSSLKDLIESLLQFVENLENVHAN